MPKFDYGIDSEKRKARERLQSGQKNTFFKMKSTTSYISVLPRHPNIKDSSLMFTVSKYDVFDRKNNKPVGRTAAPDIGDDVIRKITRGIWDRIKDSENNEDCVNPLTPAQIKKLRNLLNDYKLKSETYAHVIDLKETSKGVQIAKLPRSVSSFIDVAIGELNDDESPFYHPDNGRIIKIVHNGEEGLARKYSTVAFVEGKTNKLFSKYNLTEEEMINQMIDLETLQPKFVKEDYLKIKQRFIKSLESLNLSVDDFLADDIVIEEEDDDFEEEKPKKSKKVDNNDFEDDDFEEEKPKKSKKVAKEDEDDIDLDDDFEDEKPKKASKSKKDDDDLDDIDFDDIDFDE